ncbi:MAG: carbohydrate binding domain-containing protein [Chloroflexota bacterium]
MNLESILEFIAAISAFVGAVAGLLKVFIELKKLQKKKKVDKEESAQPTMVIIFLKTATPVFVIAFMIFLSAGLGVRAVFPPATVTPSPYPSLTPTSTFTPSPTITPTLTITPTPSQTPTNTPLPRPLVEIFPKAEYGKDFTYINFGGVLSPMYVTTNNCVHSGVYGIQLVYNMKGSGNGGWGVLWVDAPSGHFNAYGFPYLAFWIKGTSGGEKFQVGIKDTSGNEYKIESTTFIVVTKDWIMATVRLSEFKSVNISSIANVNFGFNKNHGMGSICIDDIDFVP